jgi:hypothetical protein
MMPIQLVDNGQTKNISNADFTAATAASRSVVFANGMLQVSLSFAGLSNEYVSVDLDLLQEPLM